ncbi:undecaprenyl/decaprenyl-phosphate alpha-N-acetylglucosaminyl 1-phosphate transferase [Prolixibacteraceae bacterium JC049]|nr:undecaprenyl/decaprenyl-phosphate alpha-N-acetylglucosaminyl 1-phosphate transferase [Prolixibacteraceae bacterium JC049]
MPQLVLLLLCCTVSAAIAYYSIPAIIRVANAKHLFDHPNERNVTTQVVPTLGGVAIFLGISISTTLFSFQQTFNELPYILVAAILILFVGLKDDLMNLSPRKKLIAQIAVAGILAVFADIRFTNLHGLLGFNEISYYASIPITIFTFIVMINAINLIDGIDGLASGVAILSSLTFGIWFAINQHTSMAIIAFAAVGALIAFFKFNVFGKKNKIFMGDTGSLLLGFFLAIMVIKFNELNAYAINPIAIKNAPAISYAIMIVPLTDTLRVFAIRLARKQSPFKADKIHTHHNLLDWGFSHLQATLIILAANIVFIAIVMMVQSINIYLLLGAIVSSGMLMGCAPKCLLKFKPKDNELKAFILQPATSKVSSFKINIDESPKELELVE